MRKLIKTALHYFLYINTFSVRITHRRRTIMDKLTISECGDQFIEIMRAKHYSEASLKSYRKCFTDFYYYSKKRNKEYFEDVTAIEYTNSVTGLELKGFNTK